MLRNARRLKLDRPVFVVGCGRSGTTALGGLLGHHRELAYLNEPRHIWASEPRTDVWSDQARSRRGRLELTADDLTPAAGERIRRLFAAEVRRQGAARLVEKLPINSFRIGYLDALCADCRFVHLVRDGHAVARSIAARAAAGPWFGHDGYKWTLLTDLARSRGLAARVDLCTADYARGLLEWRLAVGAVRAALAGLPAARGLEVRYEQLVADPSATLDRLLAFVDVEPDPSLRAQAVGEITPTPSRAPSALERQAGRAIAGDLLEELGYG